MSFDLAICNGIILTSNKCYNPFIGSVGIRDGLIEYVGERKILPQETKNLINAESKIVMPGLVNGHCHAEMSFARGIGDELTLAEQINTFGKINWFYDEISDEDRYYSRLLTYIEAILSGTTFLLDNTFWDADKRSLDAMVNVGIRGGISIDFCDDFAKPDSFKPVSKLMNHKVQCIENGIIPVFGNLLEESFTSNGLEMVKTLSDEVDSIITGHLSETNWRKDLIEKRFQLSSVQLLNKHNVLNQKYIGSHGIYLSDDDIDILSMNDTKIVNTPICEMKIADGIAPIKKMLDKNISVGLGTDGAIWNNSNDIFGEMKCMVLLHTVTGGIRTIDTKNVLDMATINGARVFGLEDKIGSIEIGKSADIILIDADQPHMAPLRIKNRENIGSAVVFCATGRDVSDVIINGNHLVQNKKLITIDVNEIIQRVASISEKIEPLL